MQKHPRSIHVQYLLCQWDQAFRLTRQPKRFEFANSLTNVFLFWFFFFIGGGKNFCPHLQKVSGRKKKIAEKMDSLFVTVSVSRWSVGIKSISLCSLVESLAQGVTTVSHSCSWSLIWYFPHCLSCVWVLRLTGLLDKSSLWLHIV